MSHGPTSRAIAPIANGPGMPVALYLRKSNKTASKSRDETVSIQQQRADLRRWCDERGWIIVREYVDDGKSASKNDVKRIDFARLCSDVESKGDFRAVVVWDLSRLTRKDSVDAAVAAGTFKGSNVLVESLRDGEIDLTASMGRHVWNLHAEGNHEFAKKVSGGTIRGRGDSLARGNWPHGQIPYGYRRQYWDGDKLVSDLHRRDPAGKARHWSTRIVPDPEESKYAAQIIRDFATRDTSIRGLSAEMQRIGAPTLNPGQTWKPSHVKTIIRCPVYAGDTAIGYSDGYKSSVAGGGYEAHGHSEKQTKAGAVDGIVDRATWERANAKLDALRDGRRVQAGKSSPLSGVIYCGHCGQSMSKSTRRGVTRFTCSTAARNQENPTCKQWTVQESDLLPVMVRHLVKAVDYELLARLESQPPTADNQQVATLEKQEAELSKLVSRAAKNLALADPANFEDVQEALNELKTDLDRVKNTLHLLRTAADKTELKRVADWWKENRAALVPIKTHAVAMYDEDGRPIIDDVTGGAMEMNHHVHANPDTFRELLKRLNARLTLHFTPRTMGPDSKRQYYAVEWGRLTANVDAPAVHSMRDTGPAVAPAPTRRRCASASPGPEKSSRTASVTAPPTPAWTAVSSKPTAN